MAEEQPPALTEEQQEVSSLPSSEAAGDNQTSAKEDGIQEGHTTPEKILEGKTEKDTVRDDGLDGEHQRDGQTEAKEGEEVTEEGDGGGDTVTSGGDVTEDSVTSDGEKASPGANKESSSTQEESADDFSGHKEEKSEASASSPEVAAATDVDGKSEEEQAQPSAKDHADKVDKSKSAASSVKGGAATTPGKEAAGEKEQRDRKSDIPRAKTMPKSYGRATKKDIAEKFGGVATSGIRVQRSTSCGANAVKNMLLEWCRAKTRGREGVEIQNFSSSWSSGLAFCALIVAFFPDAFDYDSLDPKNRRQNFQLAFNAAEKFADCPPLLDVEDMVRMKVPDSKCVYTYVQELYRSLVAKGLVKTKKA
ncbi:smoothelin-like protein 1 [Bufo bufo]|uniref:smoothelin-like protein 1 n=1 Tax=Bufo bufo TaxID=8384 RepID=UPI001ABE329C|nr:smoothelin-like protein 1 [Bufo bufo]